MAAARWIEITVRVAPRDVEAVAGVLGAVADGGVVIEPAIRVSDDADFEYELLDAPSAVRAYFPAPLGAADRRSLQRRLADLPLSAPLPRPRFATWRIATGASASQRWRIATGPRSGGASSMCCTWASAWCCARHGVGTTPSAANW